MEEKQIEVADGKIMNFKPSDVCCTLLINSNFTGAGVQLIKEQVNRIGGHRQPVIYDDYNQRIKSDQTCINTLTTNCGNDAERNGVKIIERVIPDEPNYRIRKLTPKECGRLMGVKDEDIDKMSVNQSNSKLYHLYGDSIVVDVLMEIFEQVI